MQANGWVDPGDKDLQKYKRYIKFTETTLKIITSK